MKIVRSDGSVLEGSPEEIARFESLTRFHSEPQIRAKAELSSPVEQIDDWEYVSADVAFRALTRIKLGKETKAVIRRIYSGGQKWTTAGELQKEIDYKPPQFAGLMGAFGRRLANTPGHVLNSAFFEQEWDDKSSCYLYRLPPKVREAVERARVVEPE